MRVKLMKHPEDPQSHDEPAILSLENVRQVKLQTNDNPAKEPADENDPKTDEAFWAGRNLAMRRSARWAA